MSITVNLFVISQFIATAVGHRSQVDVIYTDSSKAFGKLAHTKAHNMVTYVNHF